jgi:hypothetical protein
MGLSSTEVNVIGWLKALIRSVGMGGDASSRKCDDKNTPSLVCLEEGKAAIVCKD